MKRFVNTFTLLLLLLVWVTPALAQEEVIDFQKALNLALKNNIEIKIAQLTLENSEIDLKKSELQANAVTRAQQLNLELENARSKNTYATAHYNMLTGLINDFADLTKMRYTVEVNEKSLRIKELDLKTTNDLYAKGNATNIELKNAQSAVETQKAALLKSKEELARLLDELKFKIAVKEGKFKELQLTTASFTPDPTKAFNDAALNDFDLKELKIKLQQAELDLEKGQLEARPELELKKLSNTRDIAQLRVTQSQENLLKEVKDLCWNLEQQYKTIATEQVEFEVAQTNNQQISAGYKKGHYTEKELLESNINQLNAEKALFTAKVDFILSKAQFYRLTGQSQLIGGDLK